MATFYVHNIVSPKCSWGNFEQFKVHVSSRQKKKMVKSADFDGNMSIFWLKYILHMVLLHTRWLVSMGIFVLPFGPILNTVNRNVNFLKYYAIFVHFSKQKKWDPSKRSQCIEYARMSCKLKFASHCEFWL